MRLITEQPDGSRLGNFLQGGLSSQAISFRGAVAFVRASGMAHLQPLIQQFSATRPFQMIVGVDLKGSTVEGLQMLLDALGKHGQAFVYHNNGPSTFHPKMFRFTYHDRTELYVGSGNLTEGGLFTNCEAGLQLTISSHTPGGASLLLDFEQALDRWSVSGGAAAITLTPALIADLAARGLIWSEAAARASMSSKNGSSTTSGPAVIPPLFGYVKVSAAPSPLVTWAAAVSASSAPTGAPPAPSPTPAPPKPTGSTTNAAVPAAQLSAPGVTAPSVPGSPSALSPGALPRYYATTLMQTDVGRGQTTKGTAARSPEVFIPLAARDLHPAFWGWPSGFVPDVSRPGKFDRLGVPFLVNGHPANVNMMTWPVKHDFRLRSEALRSGGNVGDILVLERTTVPGLDYIATFVPSGTAQHSALLLACNVAVRNSPRRFGYF